ncbi:alpha-N-acetylgalactosaminide alpha-2,6-sialyltransferase 3-like [Acanthaster planci]|uniref:Alpha-N-acetylgalactosaminide alpha-2,6-sialyltransferase 3-like n=1 Tax=Acanthaster planci TaxID=133434 RepID=A0A8B7YGN9_ACAPL|nr:alpha-N-acetylgalactosaminide alpha-2,6-sialyltransferase 3-like [Acanthaster planci]XP_022091566.1 alpha-N-acetylgalactosaminide alpha-2,6-sialyltransferase 3-like [Acanthaster planci]XP_022091568.1 alpha-N-acetylgalactosaminide alpha-2,6-sialyltransferase 3-like [Acanthaster planci]
MESEVRPATSSCVFLRSRKFLTALILYSFVASLVIMLVLNSTKTIKVLQDGRRYSINLLNLTQRRLPDHSAVTLPPPHNETDFIFSKNFGAKKAQSGRKQNHRTVCGSHSRNGEEGCHGNTKINITDLKSRDDRLHSVQRYYKSMVDLQPLDYHCDTCALVTSSGQLLNQRAGRHIDSHSCVLRMNVAPTKGFELDVGFKTTVRVICFMSTAPLNAYASELLVGPQKADMYLFWGLNSPKRRESLARVQLLAKKYDASFYSLDDMGEAEAVMLFENETGKDRVKTNSWLSTGWFTMMLAIDMCNEIHVYGMVPDDHCRKYGHKQVRYHYWQTALGPSECDQYKSHEYAKKGGHRFITEKAIFQRWALLYNITFHNPGWNLDKRKHSPNKPINTPFMRRKGND